MLMPKTDTDDIARQSSLKELNVQHVAEIVQLSERYRSQAEAPELTKEDLV